MKKFTALLFVLLIFIGLINYDDKINSELEKSNSECFYNIY
ncbi:hypothetical protein HMPREF3186_00152 [Gemella haemolysans]|uniref:Uncharacterized protein n=1 Tax=Gemella haemolysans TaxID=1379 RepID=A0A134A6N8_9BACL|nr:hypothetical protein HMPREF3186_00152 [Gemella haemolysans]